MSAPRLPANCFTMFCVALVPPLWFALIDPRPDAVAEARPSGESGEWMRTERRRYAQGSGKAGGAEPRLQAKAFGFNLERAEPRVT